MQCANCWTLRFGQRLLNGMGSWQCTGFVRMFGSSSSKTLHSKHKEIPCRGRFIQNTFISLHVMG